MKNLNNTSILIFSLLILAGCGGDNGNTTGPEPDPDPVTTGTLEAMIMTSGPDQDSDGYNLSVDGVNSASPQANDTAYIADLEEGGHEADLSDIASNCSVDGDNPQNFSVTTEDTTSVSFSLTCKEVLNNQIAFTSNREGSYHIYVMNSDGTNPEQLTDFSAFKEFPIISNDGTQIAFVSRRDFNIDNLYVMNADGSNVRRLTDSAGGGLLVHSWSPDDNMLAYSNERNGNLEIFTIDTSGTDEQRLTQNDAGDNYPSISPDGETIVFASDRNGDFDLYTMNIDGSDVTQLTSGDDVDLDPRWSPDGSKIAFARRNGDYEIYTINADGSDEMQITDNPATDRSPSWSPDGSMMVFESDRGDDNREGIYLINADGSGSVTELQDSDDFDRFPFWSPVE